MKLKDLNFFLCIITTTLLCFVPLKTNCQTSKTQSNSVNKYDEIINKKTPEVTPTSQTEITPELKEGSVDTTTPQIEEDLILLLPKLDSNLYQGWINTEEPIIWSEGSDSFPAFVSATHELLTELGIEKILKQTYKKENHTVDLIIYKFKDFTGAYGAYTVLHSGATTKLKIGKNASESDKLINFWKGNYFVDIHTIEENDSSAKEFTTLYSQDVSKNIQAEQLPPVVAIQLPALNKVQGSEKYCLGPLCCKEFITMGSPNFDCANYNLQKSGGIISAGYQFSENSKDKERIALILTRYISKEDAQLVFDLLKTNFENKQKENKDMDIDADINDGIVKIKNKKDDYIMLKQRGNLLAIVYGITTKKVGEQLIGLVPWPIEITKSGNLTNQLDNSGTAKEKETEKDKN